MDWKCPPLTPVFITILRGETPVTQRDWIWECVGIKQISSIMPAMFYGTLVKKSAVYQTA
jgi:hypothetical protein